MTQQTAQQFWMKYRADLDKAHTNRREAIDVAKSEYRAKVREANLAFECANARLHAARKDWLVRIIAEKDSASIELLLDENCNPGADSMLAKVGYTKPDGTLSRWGRKIQAHARKMKEEGRLQ